MVCPLGVRLQYGIWIRSHRRPLRRAVDGQGGSGGSTPGPSAIVLMHVGILLLMAGDCQECLAVLACTRAQGLGHLVHLFANIRVVDALIRPHQPHRFLRGHGIGLVARQLLRLAASLSRRDARDIGRHVLEEVLYRHERYVLFF